MRADDLSNRIQAWHLFIVVVIALGGFFVSFLWGAGSFETHVTDFEVETRADVADLRTGLEGTEKEFREKFTVLKNEVHKTNVSVARLETETKNIHKGIDEIQAKIDLVLMTMGK